MRITQKEIVSDCVIERILRLLKQQKKTQQELSDYIGIAKSMFTKWKYDESKSYREYIDRIALFFGVSEKYLLYGEGVKTETDVISAVEYDMIKKFRHLTAEKQALITQTLCIISDEQENDENDN